MKKLFVGVGSILVLLAAFNFVSRVYDRNTIGLFIGIAGLSIGGGLCFIAAALSEIGEVLGRKGEV